MSINPCPECDTSRSSLEDRCPSCGWHPAKERSVTSIISAPKATGFSGWWIKASLISTMVHLLLVFLAFQLMSRSIFILEPGNFSYADKISGAALIILNLPLGLIGLKFCFYFKLPVLYLLPWVFFNSLLWGVTITAVIWSFLRMRQFKKTIKGY